MRRASFTRWLTGTLGALVFGCSGDASDARSAVLRVPEDFPGIQAAINAAQDGDTVLVARGTHAGGLAISGKAITLASRFIQTGDTTDVALTAIEGGNPILTIQSNAGAATTVRGLSFRNGEYQIVNRARRMNILDCRFSGGGADQVSFEGGGGLVRDCRFEDAGDDAVDSDDDSDPVIERNTIRNCGDDGIEVRLHDFTGPTLEVVLRDNFITGCDEDGIQLIDYGGASNRLIRIEGNILANNAMAGLGCMANGNTTENFAGAPMVEQVRIIGNTFAGNPHGLTGGDNILVMNNIFVGCTQLGVKRVAGSSLVAHNDFWNNGTNHTGSNVDLSTTLFVDPELEADFELLAGSPCIDAGAASITWNGIQVSVPSYAGTAPDLGAHETDGPPVSGGSPPRGDALTLAGVRPNPASGAFAILMTLPDAAPVRIEIVDLAGRRILSRELGSPGRGSHAVNVPEANALRAGIYIVRLMMNGQSKTTRLVVR